MPECYGNRRRDKQKSLQLGIPCVWTVSRLFPILYRQQPSLCSASSTRHCPHSLLSAALRRRYCWVPDPADFDRTALSSKLAARRYCGRMMGQTNGRTDRWTNTQPLHRPCCACVSTVYLVVVRCISVSVCLCACVLFIFFLCRLSLWTLLV